MHTIKTRNYLISFKITKPLVKQGLKVVDAIALTSTLIAICKLLTFNSATLNLLKLELNYSLRIPFSPAHRLGHKSLFLCSYVDSIGNKKRLH